MAYFCVLLLPVAIKIAADETVLLMHKTRCKQKYRYSGRSDELA
jgi:hypothetical protein